MFRLWNTTNVHFCTFLPERNSVSRLMYLAGPIAKENAVPNSQSNLQSESVMADVYLGVTVAGLYTLVGMGLVLVFM
jgi:hypothetical protein